jgi:hypothetical protein
MYKKDYFFIPNQKNLTKNLLIKEDNVYVPRFSLNDLDIFDDFPVNKPVKYSQKLMIKAIKYGMIILINYKGAKDNQVMGHERVVSPMVLGKSAKQKELLRVWHLDGWSVSNNSHTKKIWRLFRTDRILSMTFTGSFHRLPPDGYNMKDSAMRGGIIASADFNQIRKNQQTLLNQQKIQDKDDVTLSKKGSSFVVIKTKKTDTEFDLSAPFDNSVINNIKDIDSIKISFLKSIYGNKYIAILGAIGDPKSTVKVLDDKNNVVGVFKVLDSITGNVLKKIKKIKGNTLYDLYIFDRKLGV